jgi:DNA-directed RNA polymerase subunit L
MQVDGPTEASKTIIFDGEDHTLGNALRHIIMSE